jgi:hypothetical protein
MQGISGSMGTMPDTAALAARRAQMFAKADSDSNGKMTLAEFKSAASQSGPPGGGPPGGAGGPPGGGVGGPSGAGGAQRANGPPPPGGKGKMDMESMFSAMDSDGDGSVSSEESAAFEPKMATNTMSALLSLQNVEQNGSSSFGSAKTASMADIVSQLQSLIEKTSNKGTTTNQYALTA